MERLQHDLPGWTRVLSKEGLAVFVAGEGRGACKTYRLGDGVVLGTLFRLQFKQQYQMAKACKLVFIAEVSMDFLLPLTHYLLEHSRPDI